MEQDMEPCENVIDGQVCDYLNCRTADACRGCGKKLEPDESTLPFIFCTTTVEDTGTTCGQKLHPGVKFCFSCGAQIPPEVWKKSPDPMCTECNFKLPPNAKFCPDCGAKCTSAAPNVPVSSDAQPDKLVLLRVDGQYVTKQGVPFHQIQEGNKLGFTAVGDKGALLVKGGNIQPPNKTQSQETAFHVDVAPTLTGTTKKNETEPMEQSENDTKETPDSNHNIVASVAEPENHSSHQLPDEDVDPGKKAEDVGQTYNDNYVEMMDSAFPSETPAVPTAESASEENQELTVEESTSVMDTTVGDECTSRHIDSDPMSSTQIKGEDNGSRDSSDKPLLPGPTHEPTDNQNLHKEPDVPSSEGTHANIAEAGVSVTEETTDSAMNDGLDSTHPDPILFNPLEHGMGDAPAIHTSVGPTHNPTADQDSQKGPDAPPFEGIFASTAEATVPVTGVTTVMEPAGGDEGLYATHPDLIPLPPPEHRRGDAPGNTSAGPHPPEATIVSTVDPNVDNKDPKEPATAAALDTSSDVGHSPVPPRKRGNDEPPGTPAKVARIEEDGDDEMNPDFVYGTIPGAGDDGKLSEPVKPTKDDDRIKTSTKSKPFDDDRDFIIVEPAGESSKESSKASSVLPTPHNQEQVDGINKNEGTNLPEDYTIEMKEDSRTDEIEADDDKNERNADLDTFFCCTPKGDLGFSEDESKSLRNRRINAAKKDGILTIRFRVVLSNEFKVGPRDKVLIRFGSEALGGWNCSNWAMVPQRKTYGDEEFFLMLIDVPVPKNVLQGTRRILYKYSVQRGGSSRYDWEYLCGQAVGNHKDRFLEIPKEKIQTLDFLDRYDVLMHPNPPKGIFPAVRNMLSSFAGTPDKAKLEKEVKLALKAMIPSWDTLLLNHESSVLSGENAYLEITSIFQSCREALSCMPLSNHSDVLKQDIKDFIKTCLLHFEKLWAERDETDAAASNRLANVVIMILLLEEFKVDLDKSITSTLMDGLLLRQKQDVKVCPDFDGFIKFHFPNSSKLFNHALKSVADFMKRLFTQQYQEPKWIYAIPFFHFLRAESKPYDVVLEDIRPESKVWWGTKGLDVSMINTFQNWLETKSRELSWENPIEVFLYQFPLLMDVDYLLPRTLVGISGFRNLKTLFEKNIIEPEVFLACACQWWKTKRDASLDNEFCIRILNKLGGFVTGIDDSLLMEREFALDNIKRVFNIYALLEQFLKILWPRVRDAEEGQIVVRALSTFISVINFLQVACLSCADMEPPESVSHIIGTQIEIFIQMAAGCACGIVDDWLPKVFRDGFANNSFICSVRNEHELKMYSDLLSLSWKDEHYGTFFKNNLLEHLGARMSNLKPAFKIELFCSVDFNAYHKDIEDIFSSLAFRALDEIVQRSDKVEFIFDRVNSYDPSKAMKMLSNMFLRYWYGSEQNDPDNLLQHILSWPSFTRYASIFYGRDDNAGLLDSEIEEKLMFGLSAFEAAIRELVDGSITVSSLEVLLAQLEQVTELQKVVEAYSKETAIPEPNSKRVNKIQMLLKIMEVRKKELEAFHEMKHLVSSFYHLCLEIKPGKSQCLEEIEIKLASDINDMKFNTLCRPNPVSTSKAVPRPKVIYFDLPDCVEPMMKTLKKLHQSSVFQEIWTAYGRNAFDESDTDVSIASFVTDVWEPAHTEYLQLAKIVTDGSITFGQVDKFFKRFGDNYAEIMKELHNLCGTKKAATRRLQQIQEYHVLGQYQSGATAMLEVKRLFGLKGDFKDVEMLSKAGKDKNEQIGKINDELIMAGKNLAGITQKKLECIEVFSRCKPLVDWLKTSVKGPKEVQVLVDLAMISATGQGDMEVQRVSMLHAAVTGYAPLIYELAEETCFQKFIGLCQSVWKSLDADEDLPKKLKDTNRHLEWLKNVKESHGSVEVNALTQAQSINARGIFVVGNLNRGEKSIENVIVLKVRPEEEAEVKHAEAWKKYDFTQLNDLQSKLMLIAGKGEQGRDQVERFVEIFDGITRLANTYVKICAAGSILFQEWKSTFYCDQARNVCTEVDLGLSDTKLQGYKDLGLDVCKHIQNMCQFLEQCLDDWLQHIKHQRTQYYYLNHYTTTQIVILRKEMAKIAFTKKTVSNHVYPLLSFVKVDCKEANIKQAIRTTFKEMEPMEEEPEDDSMDTDSTSGEKKTRTSKRLLREVFLKKMKDSGFSKRLAEKALTELSPDQVDEGIMWCMEHSENEMAEKETEEPMTVDPEDEDSNDDPNYEPLDVADSLGTVTGDLLKGVDDDSSLRVQLESLWKKYVGKVDSSVSDYLSVEHLGKVLEELAQMGGKNFKNRSLPSFLQKGKPNLLVCNENEMYETVLSLYLHDDEQSLPLPGRDEVLICTEETTDEEVELLWHRAFGDKDGKLYCLASADLLNYEVSQKVEQSLKKHIYSLDERMDKGFSLVVICGKVREDKSHMVAALDKYRVNHSLTHPIEELRQLLNEKLKVFDSENGPAPGASIDPENVNVRLIKSHRAGVGKSHRISRMKDTMELMNARNQGRGKPQSCVTITLHRKKIDVSSVLERLVVFNKAHGKKMPQLFHFDISHDVQEGVDYLLFNLLILGSLTDSSGFVWTKHPLDMYLVEAMPLQVANVILKQEQKRKEATYVHTILGMLPSSTCWSPLDSYQILTGDQIAVLDRYSGARVDQDHDQLMDQQEFLSQTFQRPYQYLAQFDKREGFHGLKAEEPRGTMQEWLMILLRYCGLQDPSWAELKNFVSFLDTQLLACENSVYCASFLADDFPGFLLFVVKFMIQMSKDFATRSLNMAEETPGVNSIEESTPREEGIIPYMLKKRWETSPHPYVFFNKDGQTMTFLGFNIDRKTGDIQDPRTGDVLEEGAMPRALQDGLLRNQVVLNENFDVLDRDMKIMKMRFVMGINHQHDPDPTYELTTDNVKKMLAIYMRFRCGIPVIVMGETGCGKTRLIKFMCDLQKPPGSKMKNMVLMKVHGGTTEADIQRKVELAGKLAVKNKEECDSVDTVLFFDEANTTEAIGLIKEIMCDGTVNGKPLHLLEGLKLVAACNPYRKHSDEMIRRLEQAGLGYHVQADVTLDKLGRIPMRRLVYRVQPLPRSMLPLVWDFGQLSTVVEELYIRQMVLRHMGSGDDFLPDLPNLSQTISVILAASQQFRREQEDECSFVSLRDVERVMNVMTWFYKHRHYLFPMIDNKAKKYHQEEHLKDKYEPPNHETRALILALGVCYQACLHNRHAYRKYIAGYFRPPCSLRHGPKTLEREINWCQDVFLENIQLGPNIARNQALKENVFMMVVCIELRIPLFLVGKPGSSKSLAKTIIADSMQGDAAHSELFKNFKQVHMVSFQCSPLSTPDGIVGTFRQCARLQEGKDLSKFASVVVLDEVGLAEDSPRMPLKTLHPLLEDGCEGDEDPQPHKKVAFIGISNWALDPAKMNRGILVQRGIPDEKELVKSAWGICASDPLIQERIQKLIKPMSEAYLELYNSALEIREFFGLRDFYGLVKMVYGFSKKSRAMPTWYELQHAIMRNFGGLDTVKPLEVFERKIISLNRKAKRLETDPDCSATALIEAGLKGDNLDSESRYLLILTENYAALGLLERYLLKLENRVTIFGSSFPKDQEYTQVCRNINRIKVCMEAGKTVVLLNLENLYESLYDALNQYYVYLGGERFVDLGLGTQRVKCRVHKNFRLIVVAEKKVVYEKFPIPLINRLEKHFLAMSTILSEDQVRVVFKLEEWAEKFATVNVLPMRSRNKVLTKGDVFVGYNADMAASIVLRICQELANYDTAWDEDEDYQILDSAQKILLQCCAPDALVRISNTRLKDEEEALHKIYFEEQKHNSLLEFLQHQINIERVDEGVFTQITTHSRLLSVENVKDFARWLKINTKHMHLVSLQAFDTEQQFRKVLKNFYDTEQHRKDRMLLLQCDSGDKNGNLIACARHIISDLLDEKSQELRNSAIKAHVVFIVQLPRIAGGCFVGFEGGKWISCHIDELMPSKCDIPDIRELKEVSVSSLFEVGGKSEHNLEDIQTDTHTPMDTSVDREDDVLMADVNMDDSTTEPAPAKRRKIHDEPDGMDITEASLSEFSGAVAASVVSGDQKEADKALFQLGRDVSSEKNKLDVDALIFNCLHNAASMLKDREELSHRKTHRVQMLLRILKDQNACGTTLREVLRRRIYELLKDKEDTAMNALVATTWLSKEVASSEAINKAGTFRRSLWQYLEAKVAPLIAGVISFADTNSNLDILHGALEVENQEIAQLWLRMMDCSEGCVVKYKDLQSATQRSELTEFPVHGTGYDGSHFTAVCPFSWIIKLSIDQLVFQAQSNKERNVEDVEKLVNKLFSDMPLGKSMKGVKIVDRYLHDFVRMSHSNEREKECQLVEHAVSCAAREMYKNGMSYDPEGKPDYVLTIPGIHLAYQQIQRRLTLFSQAIQLWPESVDMLEAVIGDGTNRLVSRDEMTLDVLVLRLMLENLEATKEVLDNGQENRQHWMKRVEESRQLVGRFISTLESPETSTGLLCRAAIKELRPIWTKICVVHMFIKHVCPQTIAEQKLSVKNIMPLYNMLREKADFKKIESLNTVERFLLLCNTNASTHYFGAKIECSSCKQAMSDPVELECKHKCCLACVMERIAIDDKNCPHCKAKFPPNYKPTPIKEKKSAIDEHNAYKQRCNAFFMELVSTECFAGDTPPDEAVINKLMSFVTRERPHGKQEKTTKLMTIFSTDSIDPTPVVRSFLLQQLLRSNINNVQKHLEKYLEHIRKLTSRKKDTVELALLCINCFEDYYHCEAQRKSPHEALTFVATVLIDSCDKYNGNELGIGKLEAIAGTRFGLTFLAETLYNLHVEPHVDFTMHLRPMLEAAQDLCDKKDFKWPRLYLMKQLNGRYGMDCLKAIANKLEWILPPEVRDQQDDIAPDTYVVFGEEYVSIRNIVSEVLIGKNIKELKTTVKDVKIGDLKETIFLLALQRELWSYHVDIEKGSEPNQKAIAQLQKFITNENFITNKGFGEDILNNKFGKGCRIFNACVKFNADPTVANVVDLAFSVQLVLRQTTGTKLTAVLKALINEPQQFVKAFLPTMPQDDFHAVREALLATRAATGENPTMYQCPNGHPYVIGDCGRPVATGKCLVCGSQIGGHNYRGARGNRVTLEHKDGTKPGHILGDPRRRPAGGTSDREYLSPASNALMRLVLHLSMLCAMNVNVDHVAQIFNPPLAPAEVLNFLLAHVDVDLKELAAVLQKSRDDVVLLAHLVIKHISVAKCSVARNANVTWKNKKSRIAWEKNFANDYIQPVLQDLNSKLHEQQQIIVSDKRLENNKLLKALYEIDQHTGEDVNIDVIEQSSGFWKFRPRITIPHLKQKLDERAAGAVKNTKTKDQELNHILRTFIEENHQLQLLRYLPDIVKLQRKLHQKFNRTIDGSEATKMKIRDLLESLNDDLQQKDEMERLLRSFIDVWEAIRNRLDTFAVRGVRVPDQYIAMPVTYDTSVAMLLPSWKGQGFCSLATVHFLVTVQNSFLEEYRNLTGQALAGAVDINDLSSIQLISYNPEKDLIPVVLANCNYTLKVGSQMIIEYDFYGMEKQVEERFIKGRPRLDPKIDLVVFREDYTNAKVLAKLKLKIAQEPLAQTTVRQLQAEQRHLPGLCESLACLDTCIGFLVSVGGDPDMKLVQFMTEKLQMEESALTTKAGHCNLKHVEALWLQMSHNRAKLLAKYGQDPFDSIDEKYCEQIPVELSELLTKTLPNIDLEAFLQSLFEVILLQLSSATKRDENDEEFVDNTGHPLNYVLHEYIESKDGQTIPALMNQERFPEKLCVKHAVHTWRLGFQLSSLTSS